MSLTTWAPWFPNRQKSVFDSLNNQILFIGGEAFNNDPVAYKTVAERRPLSMAWAFSTQNASWSTLTLVGQVPSGTRLYHSLDLGRLIASSFLYLLSCLYSFLFYKHQRLRRMLLCLVVRLMVDVVSF